MRIRQNYDKLIFMYSSVFLNPFAMNYINDIEIEDKIASIIDAVIMYTFIYLRVFYFYLNPLNSVAYSLIMRLLANIT